MQQNCSFKDQGNEKTPFNTLSTQGLLHSSTLPKESTNERTSTNQKIIEKTSAKRQIVNILIYINVHIRLKQRRNESGKLMHKGYVL